MKQLIFLSIMLVALPLSMQAQDDDMYFVPSKKKVAKSSVTYGVQQQNTYYSGSDRSVDEYTRMSRPGSSYQYIAGDSSMNDVITFTPVEGVYPDSTAETGDFQLTRQMSRWDGYTPTDAYWEGYDRGRSDGWSVSLWHSPWYYSSYYPWYDRWYYDPWYPSWTWHAGWYYDPWYYRPYYYYGWGGYYRGYYSYHRPYHYGGGRSGYYRPSTGTQSHGRIVNTGRRYGNSGVGAGRSVSSGGSYSGGAGRASSVTGSSRRSSSAVGSGRSSSGSVGSSRSSSGSVGSSRSSSGSFGSNRSSSGSVGASRSSGGFSGGGGRSGGGSRSAGRR